MYQHQPNTLSNSRIANAILNGITLEMIFPTSENEDVRSSKIYLKRCGSRVLSYIIVDDEMVILSRYTTRNFASTISDWDFSQTEITDQNWMEIFLGRRIIPSIN